MMTAVVRLVVVFISGPRAFYHVLIAGANHADPRTSRTACSIRGRSRAHGLGPVMYLARSS
jgi:hypothetical protein